MILILVHVLYVLVAISMTVLILMQRGTGAAAGGGFGGGASATVFGSRGSSNFLSKATKWLAVVFFLIAMGLAMYASNPHTKAVPAADLGVMGSVPNAPVEGGKTAPIVPGSNVPAVPAQNQTPAPPAIQTPPASGTVPTAPPAMPPGDNKGG